MLFCRYESVDLVVDVLINKRFDHVEVLWRVDPFVEGGVVDEREVLTVNERHCCCIHIKCVKNVVWFEGGRMEWIFEDSRGLNTGRVVWRQGGDYQGVRNVGGEGILPFQPKSTSNITSLQKFINYTPLARLSIVIYIVLSIVSYQIWRTSYQIWRTMCHVWRTPLRHRRYY